jgi:hypothetical protein
MNRSAVQYSINELVDGLIAESELHEPNAMWTPKARRQIRLLRRMLLGFADIILEATKCSD